MNGDPVCMICGTAETAGNFVISGTCRACKETADFYDAIQICQICGATETAANLVSLSTGVCQACQKRSAR